MVKKKPKTLYSGSLAIDLESRGTLKQLTGGTLSDDTIDKNAR